MKQFPLLTLLLALLGFTLPAQNLTPDVIASAGGYDAGADATLSWSLGEISIETYSTASAILTQGFHQLTLGTTAATEREIRLNLLLFPNPTTETVYLQLKEEEILRVLLSISNLEGKTLWTGRMTGTEMAITLGELPDGLYILTLKSEHGAYLGAVKFLKSKY